MTPCYLKDGDCAVGWIGGKPACVGCWIPVDQLDRERTPESEPVRGWWAYYECGCVSETVKEKGQVPEC